MSDNEIIAKYKVHEPFFNNWYIKRFIGEGGFAKVFEISRNDFGSEYSSALKVITVSVTKTERESMRTEGMTERDIQNNLRMIVEATVKEIELMYKLKGNGHVVGYEDHEVVERADGSGWDILIKMELLTSLPNFIKQNHGQILRRDIIQLGIDICKALEACQKYSIIHRDIKAENIFVSSDGDFKLGDFGIARVVEKKDMGLSKKGTSTYMAPEVYKGQTYGSSVDIYSLGMVMYRLMNNNRAPFSPAYPAPISLDDRDYALLMRMSGEKLPQPNEVAPCRLTEIVRKACSYRPEERYSSPMLMRHELEAILLDEEELNADDSVRIYEAEETEEASPRRNQESFFPSDVTRTEVLREPEMTSQIREEIPAAPEKKDKPQIKFQLPRREAAPKRKAAPKPQKAASAPADDPRRVKASPKKWILSVHLAVLAVTLYVLGLVCYYNYQHEIARDLGLPIWVLSVLCFLPAACYGYLYFKQEIAISGISSKYVTRYKAMLCLTLVLMMISLVALLFAYMENLSFFYATLISLSAVTCLPMTTYGYVCYFRGPKTSGQRRVMYLADKLGVVIHAVVFIAFSIICFQWDI